MLMIDHLVWLIVRVQLSNCCLILTLGKTALQIGDKHRVTTPVNWKKGEDVIVHPSVSNDEAKTLFPQHSQHLVSASIIILKVY